MKKLSIPEIGDKNTKDENMKRPQELPGPSGVLSVWL